MKKILIACLSMATLSFGQLWQSGFIGEGARQFANTFGSKTYVTIGNQNDKSNPRVIQSLLPSADPAVGEQVVYRVATMNARLDGYGQNIGELAASLQSFGVKKAKCYFSPFCWTQPTYTWFQPNLSMILNIEKDQIITALRRWKQKGIKDEDIIFEIGNEPNYYVSMTPGEYAYLYRTYYQVIKRENPNIKVAIGSLFAFEMIPQDSRNLIAKMMIDKGIRETNKSINEKIAPLYNPLAFLGSLGTSALIGLGFDAWGTYAGERATRDVKNLIFNRMFRYTSVQYMTEVVKNLPADIVPDIVSMHFYPGDLASRSSVYDLATQARTISQNVRDVVLNSRYYSYPPPEWCSGDWCGTRGPKIFITEFGNINPYLDENEIANRMMQFVFEFQGVATAWFWYKPVGSDAQMELAKDLNVTTMPVTRLVTTETYGTIGDPLPPFPALIPCSRLNPIGLYYYYISNEWKWCNH